MKSIDEALIAVSELFGHVVRMGNGVLEKVNCGETYQEEVRALAKGMESLAKTIGADVDNREWNEIYDKMKAGVLPDYFAERMLEWEDLVCEWMERTEKNICKCNICNKKVIYVPKSNYYAEQQKKYGFPYWNSVFESVSSYKNTCPNCGSLDRERMMAMFIDLLGAEAGQKIKVLQIAPSQAMDKWLREKDYIDYETTDLYMDGVTFKSDIQDMYMVADETYDVIICSHVLEHVENDRKAMVELKRILKKDGICLFLVPLVIGLSNTDEEFGCTEEENWKRFGQDDHARLYGKKDFLNRLLESGYLLYILDANYFGEELWREVGLSDIHRLYVATKQEIGIGIEPYAGNIEQDELVSVVIPTHNRGYCIERAIKSVLRQTWKNLELIIVDDASTDNTESVIREMEDSRIHYIKLPENRGANYARNIGIKNSKGQYVAFNDSDDEWLETKLEKQMQLMKIQEVIEGDKVGAVYCIMTKYDNGKVWQIAPEMEILGESGMGDIYQYMQANMFISTQTLLFRKRVLEEVGYFNEELKRLQDWELLLRVAQKYKFYLVQENLVDAYVQEDCISNNNVGWMNTVLYAMKLHKMNIDNKYAYRTLMKSVVRRLKGREVTKEYKEKVFTQIEEDGVFSKRQVIEMKKDVGIEIEEERGKWDFKIYSEMLKVIEGLVEKVEKQEKLINRLYANYNVKKGWQLEINKEKINYELERWAYKKEQGICNEKRATQIIVSLTSYPERMYDIKYTLYSLLNQSLKPDRLILWLAKEQYPNLEGDIAPSILAMKSNGLEIMWCEDIKSYKKLVPSLKLFSEDIIVTADDDIYYPEDWLEKLYNSYLKNPKVIHAHRAHIVKVEDGAIAPYNDWEQKTYVELPTYYAFPTSGGGVLYPPHSLCEKVLDKDIFLKIAPKADDVWFWAMALLNSTKVQIVKDGYPHVTSVNYAREIGLCEEKTLFSENVREKEGNELWIKNVIREFPTIIDILSSDGIVQSKEWASADYWEERYRSGGSSGAGSYNNLAEFKARILNDFVMKNEIQLVVEWGCGDGNQLSLAEYPLYVGFDVSKEVIGRCKKIFAEDQTKSFFWSGSPDFESDIVGDLALSLDVIYHLVEDDVFELYMRRLFGSSAKYVCIYSCDFEKEHAKHVKCRKFTEYVDNNFNEWKLKTIIKNDYPYDETKPNTTSWSDFYIYEKML